MTAETPAESLNHLTPAQLEAARNLASRHRNDAVRYLERLVNGCSIREALRFVDEVLLGTEDATTWGQSDVLVVPGDTVERHLRLDATTTLDTLGAVDGERWWRAKPQLSGWPHGVGAPGVLLRGVSYRWQPKEGLSYSRFARGMASRLEHVTDPVISLRRWIASRACWQMREHGELDVSTFLDRISLSPDELSPDGVAALSGLTHEIKQGLLPWGHSVDWAENVTRNPGAIAPGFLASDDAYS